jgi:hypothetical protein
MHYQGVKSFAEKPITLMAGSAAMKPGNWRKRKWGCLTACVE